MYSSSAFVKICQIYKYYTTNAKNGIQQFIFFSYNIMIM